MKKTALECLQEAEQLIYVYDLLEVEDPIECACSAFEGMEPWMLCDYIAYGNVYYIEPEYYR